MLYASTKAKARIGSLGHYFHAGDSLTNKLGLASASYELVAALPKVIRYFGDNREERRERWDAISRHEEGLQRILLNYLINRSDVKVYGYSSADRTKRVPVISFWVTGRNSQSIVKEIEQKSLFGCRSGHFYSKRLVDEVLNVQDESGVIRVSLVHYNTEEEIEGFVEILDDVLESR